MKPLEARDRLDKIAIGDLELKVYLMDMLEKYDRIQKIIRQNGHIPKYDSDVDAESFSRIRKVVLHR